MCISISTFNNKTDHALAHIVLIAVYGGARLGHTIVYVAKLSVLRTAVWMTGQLAVLAMGINAIISSFSV